MIVCQKLLKDSNVAQIRGDASVLECSGDIDGMQVGQDDVQDIHNKDTNLRSSFKLCNFWQTTVHDYTWSTLFKLFQKPMV